MKNRKRSRGFALVEVIVSLAVIAVVCATVLACTQRSVVCVQRDIRSNRAMLAAENAYSCFLYADSIAEFEREMRVSGLDFSGEGGFYEIDFSGKVILSLTVYSFGEKSAHPTFHAKLTAEDRILFDVTYRKV